MFQHTQRRVELGCEQQRDMEQAFEGLFIKTHGGCLGNRFNLNMCTSISRYELAYLHTEWRLRFKKLSFC